LRQTILTILAIFLLADSFAQTNADSIYRIQIKNLLDAYDKPFENYYAPFHCKIKDTTQFTISEFGHYVSFGLGGATDKNVNEAMTGQSVFMSYTLAYKSHLFSMTHVGFGMLNYGGGDRAPYFGGGYYGFLIGESVRVKYLFFSLSTGIAYSNTTLRYPASDYVYGMNRFDRQDVSYPIELKLFLLARNGIGFGIHLSKNIISPVNYSPFCWGVSIVFGKWNNPRVKNWDAPAGAHL